jgi:hypothetical protein
MCTPDAVALAEPQRFQSDLVEKALQREAKLGYDTPSGRYWQELHRFDPAQIDRLDALWLRADHPVLHNRA